MSANHILITGFPGVGKTTLIKKTIDRLKDAKLDVGGFYTEEIRNEAGQRIGFDVVTLDGQRGRLARSTELVQPDERTKFTVGQYVVFPKDFERLVLPVFKTNAAVLVLDEIGKMELFSGDFKRLVGEVFGSGDRVILASVPAPKGKPVPFLDAIRNNPKCTLFTVEKTNRDVLLEEILKKIL